MKLAIFCKEEYRPLLRHCVNGIDRNVTDPITERYLISAEGIENPGFITVTDDQLWEKLGSPIPMTLQTIAHAGYHRWYRQQILKLGIDLLTDDDTLVVDADLLFLRPVSFINQTYMAEEFEPRYFAASEILAGVPKIADLSFVTDFGFFQKPMLEDLRATIEERNGCHWIEAIARLPAEAILSEYELYGNFALQKSNDRQLIPPDDYRMDEAYPMGMIVHADLVTYLHYESLNYYQSVSISTRNQLTLTHPELGTLAGRMMAVPPVALSGCDLLLDFNSESPSTKHLTPVLSKAALTKNVTLITSSLIEETPGVTVVRAPLLCFSTLKPAPPPINTSTHFLLLMRIPKRHRIILGAEVSEVGLAPFGNISCCSWDGPMTTQEVILSILSEKEQTRYRSFIETLPLILDGKVDYSDHQYDTTNPLFTECLVNVVAETSYEPILPEPFRYLNWEILFLTEKTAKPFISFQIPIWCAVRGTVEAVRNLGFDVFDDVIDHSYDNEPDPRKRISMVVQELKRFVDRVPVNELTSLRQNLVKRFRKNFVIASRIIKDAARRSPGH